MTRERYEQILFAHVHDEVVQDMLNQYVLELEAENAKLRKAMDFQALELGCMTDNRDVLYLENEKLRELIADVHEALRADKAGMFHKLILANMEDDMRELGMELDG